ncbi:MAG: cytochrome c biogenesis protein CcsA [Bacteroidales bacterium]|nr:cytochrome c biogenesis protein CcsA [Bacteroidales bacterium]
MQLIHLLGFPISLILAVAFVFVIFLLHKIDAFKKVTGVLSSQMTAVVLLGVFAVILMVEGTFGMPLHKSVAFLVLVLLLMLSLGLVTLRGFRKYSAVFTLSHLGLFLVLFGGFFGAPDYMEARMMLRYDTPEHVAFKSNGEFVALPFEVTLEDFKADYYDDGKSPKQYTSTLSVDGVKRSTSVNHPCSVKGYTLYQEDYDWETGDYSVIMVVRDNWIPVVYLGMILLALSAVFEMKKTWKSRATLPVIIVLAVVFTILSLARINLGTLMPALRSLWFFPHIIIYMLAYSVLAVAVALGIMSFFKERTYDVSCKLLQTGSALLLAGMLCGSVWAKAAWGDYWAWDPKENWAAATWLLTLLGSHIPNRGRHKVTVIAAIIVSFMAIQMTWYGVNYLPSSSMSMHTYNK